MQASPHLSKVQFILVLSILFPFEFIVPYEPWELHCAYVQASAYWTFFAYTHPLFIFTLIMFYGECLITMAFLISNFFDKYVFGWYPSIFLLPDKIS